MKIKHNWLVIGFAMLAAGCSTNPNRSSGSFLGDASRSPEEHIGQLVSSFGSVMSVRESDTAVVFRVATPNYAFVFDISYPGDIPGLDKGRDVMFLGTITGSLDSSNVYYGKILKIDAIAVHPVGHKLVFRPEQQDVVQSWLDRKLNLSGSGVVVLQREPAIARVAPRQETVARPAPSYAPSYASNYAPVPPTPAPEVRSAPDASDLKVLLKKWNASSGDVKARMRDFLERWNSMPEDQRTMFLNWSGLSDEDRTLFRQLVTDSGSQ